MITTVISALAFIWLAVIPLIVKVKTLHNPMIGYYWADQTPYYNDFFLYYKMLAIIAVGIVFIIIPIFVIKLKKSDDNLYNIKSFNPDMIICSLAAVLAGTTIMSSLLSVDLPVTLTGFPGLFETFFVRLAYIAAFFYFYWWVCIHGHERFLLFIRIGTLAASLICFCQAIGFDIYRIFYQGKGYEFTFEKGTVYGSFFNPNYVGGYVVLILPFMLYFVLSQVCSDKTWDKISEKTSEKTSDKISEKTSDKTWDKKSLKPPKDLLKAFDIITLICLITALFKADSQSSVIALLIIAYLGLLMILLSRKKRISPLIILTVLAIGATCFIGRDSIVSYLKAQDKTKRDLLHIYTRKDYVEIQYRDRLVHLYLEGTRLRADDEIYGPLPLEYREHTPDWSTIHFEGDEELERFRFEEVLLLDNPDMPAFVMTYEGIQYVFTDKSGLIDGYCYSPLPGYYIVLDESIEGETFKPLSHLSGLFARGYIWSKTIPILKDCLVLGSGPDTFPFMFPNGDVMDMYNNKRAYGGDYITKPHSLYLQMGVETGVLSLIAYLLLCIYIIIKNLRAFISGKDNNDPVKTQRGDPAGNLNLCAALSIMAFMIYGLCNDSSITTAPVFWAILGFAAAMPEMLC